MPFAGYRDYSYYTVISNNGSNGYYRSSTPYSATQVNYFHLISHTTIVSNGYRADGFSVRCFKNTTNADNLTIHAN